MTKKMNKMKADQAGLLWRQCANLQPLLEEGTRNGAPSLSTGLGDEEVPFLQVLKMKKKMKVGQADLIWLQCANHQPL